MINKRPIKIFHLRSSGGMYGAEAVILTIVRELEGKGCENHIVCINNLKNPHAELVEEAERLGIKATAVDSIGMFDWEAIKEIRRIIKEGNFDILHFHDYKASIYGFLASYWLAPKRVVTNHGWTSVSWKVSLYQLVEGFLYNKFNRIIAVSERMKYDIRPYIVHKSKIEVITNGIDVSAFSGNAHSSSLVDDGKTHESRAMSQEQPNKRSEFGLKDDDVVIGIVGRLSREKGHAYLLKAMASLLANAHSSSLIADGKSHEPRAMSGKRNLRLLVVGDGGQERNVKNLCRELGLSFIDLREQERDPSAILNSQASIVFAGARNDMPDVYPVMDLLVMPSLQEGLPMVLLEAMAAGVPVIATPVGQIPEIVKDEETGFIVQPGSAEDLQSVLERVVPGVRPDMALGSWLLADGKPHEQRAMSYEQIQNIINAARRLVEEEHSSQVMARKYLETYEWLAE